MTEGPASKSFAVRARRQWASPLTWLNLICLDAPLVAIAWQWAFARSFGVPVGFGATLALFLTAWLIYLADRFGDSLSIDLARATALRQRFCLRHRQAWGAGIAIVVIADVFVISVSLSGSQWMLGAVVAICAAVYLLVNQLRQALWRVVPLKEISIGVLFAAGTMVPLAGGLTSGVLVPWLLFASLCALNCICIAAWERYLDVAQQRISVATAFPVVGFVVMPALALLSASSVALALFGHDHREMYWCVAASAALLALLHVCGRRISQDVRTALADVALLTPVFALTVR